jgi:hypothetical protein
LYNSCKELQRVTQSYINLQKELQRVTESYTNLQKFAKRVTQSYINLQIFAKRVTQSYTNLQKELHRVTQICKKSYIKYLVYMRYDVFWMYFTFAQICTNLCNSCKGGGGFFFKIIWK